MQLYAVFNIISNAWAPLVQASTYTNLEHVDWCLLIYIQDFSWPNISQSLGRLQIQSVRLRIGWLRVLVGIWKSVRLVGLYLNWWLYAPQMCLTLHGKSVADAKRNLFDRHSEEGPPVPIQEYVILKLVLLHINVHLFLNPIKGEHMGPACLSEISIASVPKEKPGHRWLRKHRLHRIHCGNSEYLGGIQCF